MSGKHITQLITRLLETRASVPVGQSMLAGISGIDASGKGHVAGRLDKALRGCGLRTALINVDGWLNLPDVRFSSVEPGRHFYEKALRLDEMFEQLIFPLQAARSNRLTAELAAETANQYHRHEYVFDDIDIILVEGIFIFKPRLARHFDLKVWIDCSFETALCRAIARSQEGLGHEATVTAYETIYFPAQAIHLDRDDPRSSADIIIDNN